MVITKKNVILMLLDLMASCSTIKAPLSPEVLTINREIASINTQPCTELIKQFLAPSAQPVVWHSLKKFSLNTRLKFFNRLAKLPRTNASSSQKMATLLNQAIEEGILSPVQVETLIKQFDNAKLRELLIIQNNRVHYRLNSFSNH